MARAGTLEDPSILLIALAKFNCEKAGRASVQTGYGIQVEMNRQNRMINTYKLGSHDYASTQMLSLDLKKSTQTTTDFTQLVQSAAKFAETWTTLPKTCMESYYGNRAEIIRKIGM